jgi:Xaa-Pro aminopeptidase
MGTVTNDAAAVRLAARLSAHLLALRAELARRGLDGFVVPYADEHQGEYVPAASRRLEWLTGFAGSAGTAVVLADRAAIFVDGRYTLQVRQQVPGALYEFRHLVEEPHADWIAAASRAGGRVGFDPRLHTTAWVERTRETLARAGVHLEAVDDNPLDAVWTDRPSAPVTPMVAHDLRFAGVPASHKRASVGAALAHDGCAAAVLTQPESVAWLLNVRGSDVPNTPLSLAFAILRADGTTDLFLDRRKLSPGIETHFGNQVAVFDPDAFGPALDRLASLDGKIRIDPATANAWVVDRLQKAGVRMDRGQDPVARPRACKNAIELDGARAAHRRDAAALVRFLHWLSIEGPTGHHDEIAVAARLRAFRAEAALFRDDSFDAIAGFGPNGAIVHYRATPETTRRVENGSLLLIDSGGQYLDGTTDVTRTVAIGSPTAPMRRHFTLVLKGHIALATARFPKGTTGSQIDALARRPLWQEGLDYDHGTGHGVGSFLGVHEGPARISKIPNTVALEPGMILSNEPGYYRPGAYGIRIENLVAVRPCPDLPDADRGMLEFETLTLAPIDRSLIERALLSPGEADWIDAYHARVLATVGPGVDDAVRDWLATATAPLDR